MQESVVATVLWLMLLVAAAMTPLLMLFVALVVSTGRRGWGTSRMAAPVVAVLFRSSSWVDVTVR